ncbi:MAG: EutN/CcmL family microcompartment protein [Candidatus Sericytochromatia bacterium]|nr:EutN/CcmL family microcompartment protein [Candidatus Sericytochromatia bacterium]
MQLAIVVGNVVASRKEESLKGIKMMIVQKVNAQNTPTGAPFIAIDATTQAGVGDLVFIESGREAALGIPGWFNPADQAILGIVDQVHVEAVAH